MADHSFDIVSKVDMQEVSNAIQQSMKEIGQRFDFKGSKSNIELESAENKIVLISDDEYKLKNVVDILQTKLIKRKVPVKAFDYGKVEDAASSTVRQVISIQEGIATDKSKEIVKIIKGTKLKVQAEIQKDQLRVRAKKIDDLRELMDLLKGKDLGIHIEFMNFR